MNMKATEQPKTFEETEQYAKLQEWQAKVDAEIARLYPESVGFDPMNVDLEDK